jgi:hypothetical protein
MGKDYETRFRESGKGVAGYADFGALGDGKTDDTPALTRATVNKLRRGSAIDVIGCTNFAHDKPFLTLLPLASTPLRGFSATPTPSSMVTNP